MNFRHPYRSLNVTEFWRRWHISLSGWLRDYLYIPLGGNRKGQGRAYVNLGLTMLLGGLWHGASWNFVVWGGLHGAALAVNKLWNGLRGGRKPIRGVLRTTAAWAMCYVFVLMTWVFFRAQDFPTAWAYLRKMAFFDHAGIDWYYVQAMVVILTGAALHVAVVLRHDRDLSIDLRRPWTWGLVVGALFLVLLYAPFGQSPFIYFQF